jgi:Tol biopolymer transport system component
MRRLVVLAALTLLPSAAAGSYFPPPGDSAPTWARDGTRLYFWTARNGSAIASVGADASRETRIVEGPVGDDYALSPDASLFAYTAGSQLRVAAADGSGSRILVDGRRPSWSPDSNRIAYEKADSIFVVGATGGAAPRLLARGADAAWSPVSDLVAYVQSQGRENLDVHVIGADGSGDVNLTASDDRANIRPKWSPDGHLLAFLTSTGKVRAEVVEPSGEGRRELPLTVPITNGVFTWSPAGELVVGTDTGVVALDVVTGKQRRLALPAEPVWSRDGSRLAFATGGECRDRVGIYVGPGTGKGARRITNDCRIFGTPGDDKLRGTELADVLLGLGGNDRLVAVDAGYVGDTLLGGQGDDVLVGGYRSDILEGGAGDDRLSGGPSADRLDGGPGLDSIDGQGGRDLILARDGRRDRIVCGTNSPGTPERDEVFADRIDRVAADCEVVHRT